MEKEVTKTEPAGAEEIKAEKAEDVKQEGKKPEEAKSEGKKTEGAKPGKKRRKKKGKKKVIFLLLLAAALIAAGVYHQKKKAEQALSAAVKEVSTGVAVRMDISSELTASSSLSPKDTYEVTSLVEGEILEASFEEGDVVEKDQVLYRIDASSMDRDLSSAETSLERAKEKVSSAKSDYSKAAETLSGNTYRSPAAGYIKELHVKAGDKVGNGAKLAELYDDSVMELTVPFLTGEAELIHVGDLADVTLEDTGEQVQGTVTNVSSLEIALSGGRLMKEVTVEVQNPGGLTSATQATARVGDFLCGAEGTFEAKTETSLTVELSGNQTVEIESLLAAEGSRVEIGSGLFTVTAQSASDYLKTFEDSMEAAEDSLKTAENQLENTRDSLEGYTITAPISGTIVTKNSKVGDKISRGSGTAATMAVIYDLSSMTLEMSVDELDVMDVKVGQTVEITAEAIEGEVFTGTVTNVSLQGSYSNGVTNYPVTVELTETGDLRPGMNVDAKIILDSSENAVCIPAGALLRGNRVYIKNTDGAEASKAVEGLEGGEGAAVGLESAEGMAAAGPEGEKEAKASAGKGSRVPEGFREVTVDTGVISDDYVEILSGVEEGDIVYVDPSAGKSSDQMFMMAMPMGGPGGPRR